VHIIKAYICPLIEFSKLFLIARSFPVRFSFAFWAVRKFTFRTSDSHNIALLCFANIENSLAINCGAKEQFLVPGYLSILLEFLIFLKAIFRNYLLNFFHCWLGIATMLRTFEIVSLIFIFYLSPECFTKAIATKSVIALIKHLNAYFLCNWIIHIIFFIAYTTCKYIFINIPLSTFIINFLHLQIIFDIIFEPLWFTTSLNSEITKVFILR